MPVGGLGFCVIRGRRSGCCYLPTGDGVDGVRLLELSPFGVAELGRIEQIQDRVNQSVFVAVAWWTAAGTGVASLFAAIAGAPTQVTG